MRVAFLIMAYKDPEQLERLIKKFRHPAFDFYIHLDKKIPRKNFSYLSELEGVYFIQKSVKVNWASYSLTKGILNSIEEIFASGRKYDFISNISGQDYPIKPVNDIYTYLEQNLYKNFIYYEDPGDEWWNGSILRVKKYDMSTFHFRGKYRLQLLMNTFLPEKKFPLPYKLFGGPCSTFMTLTAGCAKYVVKFMKSNKSVRRFARFSWAVDEFLFPTLIMNSPFKESTVNNNLIYIDFSAGGYHPKVFTQNDFDLLQHSDKLFARKFDYHIDAKIMDMLDAVNG